MTDPDCPLVLTGFMGVGKTTLGRRVAARAGAELIDLDALIEARHGSLEALFQRGESTFRELEERTLRELLSDASSGAKRRVIALGGGALLSRALRLWVLERALVVCLRASAEELTRRLTASHEVRPLLRGRDPRARIEALLEQRAASYGEAHHQLEVDGLAVDEAAEACLALWQRPPVLVASGLESYGVWVGHGLLAEQLPRLIRSLRPAVTGALWVTDENVERHHGALRRGLARELGAPGGSENYRKEIDSSQGELASAGFRAEPEDSSVSLAVDRFREETAHVLAPGEEHKALAALAPLYQRCLEIGLDRRGLLLALGGGVVSDVTGFAAATWMRGVRWVGLPSTLLAMVDASVGGKTGVDLGAAKNAVGAFWQPSGVLCDVALLATEPERGLVSALAEVVKTALIGDPALLELLESEPPEAWRDPLRLAPVVERSVRVKARIVSLDPHERGPRAHLNLGHTLGHAVEAHGGYGRLTHGEAVSVGLVAALRLGVRRGHTPAALATRVEALLARLGLPTDPAAHQLGAAARLIAHDKKRQGDRVRFVFVAAPGQVFTEAIPWAPLVDDAATL
ncbi:MAG: bifunctional shikimate kinase/3-dehydroquinate synthase [Polyangiaceae bacterium]|nr:bifunctional shikimate kinase/3-dehydroquinate synthase [Polyangiaceae bacterium]MCW5790076.1 bifunctional shikimate kinase/3-dehydroquinate synthase [Polyangiaceae bacterium]